jgi:hypothetical protein
MGKLSLHGRKMASGALTARAPLDGQDNLGQMIQPGRYGDHYWLLIACPINLN